MQSCRPRCLKVRPRRRMLQRPGRYPGIANIAGRKPMKKAGMFFTRGVLIDVAGYEGVEMLGDSHEITVDDLERAVKKQNLTLQPGDAIIIHTGWGKLYGKDNARFIKSCPGIGVKAAQWLIEKDPILLRSGNWPVEGAPNPDPQVSLPRHHVPPVAAR